MENKNITVTMDIEDGLGNNFKADVTISISELTTALSSHGLTICEKEKK